MKIQTVGARVEITGFDDVQQAVEFAESLKAARVVGPMDKVIREAVIEACAQMCETQSETCAMAASCHDLDAAAIRSLK